MTSAVSVETLLAAGFQPNPNAPVFDLLPVPGDARRVLRAVVLDEQVEFRALVRLPGRSTRLAGPLRRSPHTSQAHLGARVRFLSGYLRHLPPCDGCGAPLIPVLGELGILRCATFPTPARPDCATRWSGEQRLPAAAVL